MQGRSFALVHFVLVVLNVKTGMLLLIALNGSLGIIGRTIVDDDDFLLKVTTEHYGPDFIEYIMNGRPFIVGWDNDRQGLAHARGLYVAFLFVFFCKTKVKKAA
jgi:hypothetical protein